MTDEQRADLNANVAQTLGWRDLYRTSHTDSGWVGRDPRGGCRDVPDFLSWAGAGLVLDWLAGQEDVAQIGLDFVESRWKLRIYSLRRCFPERGEIWVDTPQEAVCRALLAWNAARAKGEE